MHIFNFLNPNLITNIIQRKGHFIRFNCSTGPKQSQIPKKEQYAATGQNGHCFR